MRCYRIPYSTNVERVALALAHKGLSVQWVDVDPEDRRPVIELSGQDLVPVLHTNDGEVVADSMRIVAWLEEHHPDRPLWPAAPARRAEVDLFVEWFNRVWKVPPNAIAAELDRPEPNKPRVRTLAREMEDSLPRFEALLDGRDWLMGDAFGAADLCAFPFLKYGLLGRREDDHDRFHEVLVEHLPIRGRYPRLEGWIHRVDALPRG